MPQKKRAEKQPKLSDRLFDEKNLYQFLETYAEEHQLTQTAKALPYAAAMHKGQVRRGKDQVPFIYHPLLVSCHGISLGLTQDNMIAAALLHDVCEDCGVTPEELPVPPEVQEAVKCLTRVCGPESRSDDAQKAYYERIAQNPIATMVKLLDRCNNVSSMTTGFTEEGIRRYIRDTEKWIYPLILRAEKAFPEYDSQLFALQYHIKSVVEGIKRGLVYLQNSAVDK